MLKSNIRAPRKNNAAAADHLASNNKGCTKPESRAQGSRTGRSEKKNTTNFGTKNGPQTVTADYGVSHFAAWFSGPKTGLVFWTEPCAGGDSDARLGCLMRKQDCDKIHTISTSEMNDDTTAATRRTKTQSGMPCERRIRTGQALGLQQ